MYKAIIKDGTVFAIYIEGLTDKNIDKIEASMENNHPILLANSITEIEAVLGRVVLIFNE